MAKVKTHLGLIAGGSVLSALSLGSILSFTEPATAGLFTHILLYLSVFLLVCGLGTLAGILVRQWLIGGIYLLNLAQSFRQAILLGLLITSSLLLLAFGLLYWWVEVSLVLFLLCIELFMNIK